MKKEVVRIYSWCCVVVLFLLPKPTPITIQQIRAIVGAGLYPNVAKVSVTRSKTSTYPILSSATEYRINIHMRYA